MKRGITPASMAVATALLIGSCRTQKGSVSEILRPDVITPDGWTEVRLPPEKAEPVVLDMRVIPAGLCFEDVENIRALLGRIPHIDKHVLSIRAAWPPRACAAEVITRGYAIYFVRTRQGWDIAHADYLTVD